MEKEEKISAEVVLVLLVFTGLLLAGVLREVNKRAGTPFFPLLLGSGMIAGYFRGSLGVIYGESLSLALSTDPRAILLIFLPALLFESGLSINWYLFKKSAGKVLLLAFPGVAVGSLMLGISWNWILGYSSEMGLFGALTATSILCATDPISVTFFYIGSFNSPLDCGS